ncbi:MAG: hypothetical protein ACREDM_12615, partial [Methylocella sp.]
MRNDHGLPGAGAPLRHFRQRMTVTEHELLLGEGTLLAKIEDDGLSLEGEEERILTLLAVAYGRDVPAATLGSFRRAAKHWRGGDKCLAAIHLAQNGLGKLDAAGAYRLSLADELIEAGMTPRELARELGLSLPRPDLGKAGYDPNEARTPPGYHHESGEWSKGGASASTLTTGRSAATGSRKPHQVPELPKDAVVVKRPDGTTIDDPYSTTNQLVAPSRANFHDVYVAGTRVTNPFQINAYVGHYGQYDYQRDKASNTYYPEYKHSSNYAVGVFMAGAGYTRERTSDISETFAYFYSRNYKTDMAERKYWTYRGWDDAHDGIW